MSLLFWRKKTPTQIQILENTIAEKENKLKELENAIDSLSNTKYCLEQETLEAQEKLSNIEAELNLNEGRVMLDTLGIQYTPTKHVPAGVEFQIMNAKDRLAIAIKQKTYYIASKQYIIDGSESKGKKFVDAFCENNILGFNLYCEKKKKSISVDNYGETIRLVEKAFDKYSKRLNIIQAKLNPEYLEYTKRLLTLELDLKVAKAKEKEKIKEEKRKLREEQQLLAEAEKERKRLEEERKAMDLAFNKALTDDERQEIKNKLTEIDKRIADVDYRVNNPKAGLVYIIHSDSLPDLEKIGVSRRLSGPHERIKELSGSSLPTPFMLDAFCFSDDAFELESNLHKYFDKQRVNPSKEFFRVTAQEAINAMENVFNHKAHIVNLEDNDNEID